jgi:hypothetical protein
MQVTRESMLLEKPLGAAVHPLSNLTPVDLSGLASVTKSTRIFGYTPHSADSLVCDHHQPRVQTRGVPAHDSHVKVILYYIQKPI